ncbi:hypothetical protein ACWGK7_19275 (plasmid) [Sphingomonas aurantiaca]
MIDLLSRSAADAPGRPEADAVIQAASGKQLLRIDRTGRGGPLLTLPARSGATRAEVDAALAAVLDRYWG